MNKILISLAVSLVVLAIVFSMALLASDVIGVAARLPAATISGLPLLAVGLSFLIVQSMIRPRWTELLKNILLAATFLLWGIVQLMAHNLLSKKLGDVVIALYVVDLAWTILARMHIWKWTEK
jgi:hypothetical protein